MKYEFHPEAPKNSKVMGKVEEYTMSISVEALEAEALHLPPGERARLIERLIASLDVDPEVEEAWAAEVERRQAQIDHGEVSLLSGPETLSKLKAEFE